MSDEVEKSKKKLRPEKTEVKEVDRFDKGLSIGSTLINLACTGRPHVGYLPGQYYSWVGDSQTGKSWLALTSLAEAANNPNYDKYRFIYDNPERRSAIDLRRYFGKKAAARIEPPSIDNDQPKHSETIEEFYYHVDDAIDEGKPFIYVLDSMDSITSESDQDKFEERKQAHKKGKEAPGSYGDGKAKANSSGLRRIIPHLAKTDSILIVIGQTRDNIGFGSQFNPKTRSGGRALKFYAMLELWTSLKGDIKKNIRGKPRQLGIRVVVKVEKNNITGQEHKVEVPLYWSFGIDDTGSMIDWLVDEGIWTKTGQTIDAKDLGIKGTYDGLIAQIEERDLENELKLVVTQAWEDIVEACQLHRRKRYE